MKDDDETETEKGVDDIGVSARTRAFYDFTNHLHAAIEDSTLSVLRKLKDVIETYQGIKKKQQSRFITQFLSPVKCR